MSVTQPIKNLEKLEQLKNYYKTIRPNIRNHTLIVLGINTALRISDLLALKWKDVYDFPQKKFRRHIDIIEKKTKKENLIAMNENTVTTLTEYMNSIGLVKEEEYLFKGSDKSNISLSRSQAFRIIKNASRALFIEGNISCHSLRKTLGYHAWKSGVHPVLLMNLYNHSSYQITKRYLGIDQDDKDNIFLSINL